MPASALTTADFTDIPDNWAKPAISYVLEKGLMTGVGDGKFNPGGTVNRAQIAQVLYNREDSPSIDGLENPFSDVSDQWFAKAVIWCKNNGVVSGNSATTFNPMGQVTRQDICVMVYNYVTNYLNKTAEMTDETKMSSTFTDWDKAAGYAKNALRWANKAGFMSGTSATTLAPTGKATREQLAQFLKNLDKVLENEKEPEPDNPDLPDIPGFPKDGKFEPIPKDWVPKGGYWDESHTRKYNMYGIDITDVDGVPMADEIHIMELINSYRVQNGLPKLKWSRYAQVMSEIRVRETSYLYAHTRPDGTNCFAHDAHVNNYDPNCIACQKGIGANVRWFEELKLDNSVIDPDMTSIGKKVSSEQRLDAVAENAYEVYHSQLLPQYVVNGWINSPGHDAALKADFDKFDCEMSGYFAVAQNVYTNADGKTAYSHVYNAFGIEWTYDDNVEPDTNWYPGKGVDYNSLGFTVNDIPDEYTDWIERELDMTPEEYGPADHTADAVLWYIRDHGVQQNSELELQVEAHYCSTLEMDDYIKYAISKTDWLHWTMIDAGTLANAPAWEIPAYKAELVKMVADKLAYNHFTKRIGSEPGTKCHVCLQDHTEKRDLNAAESIVNQFFMDTYGFDISKY